MARSKSEESYQQRYERRRKKFDVVKTTEGWEIRNKIEIPPCNRVTALLFAFKTCESPEEKEWLFWEIADIFWNKDPDEKRFIKQKWSWKIIHHCCREKWLSVGGSASSGKSYTLAGWALVNWMADPGNTLVLVTSTDISGAKKRIYGAISKLIKMIPDYPAKILSHIGHIRYCPNGKTTIDTAGIQIVTADKSKNAEDMGKLVGAKSPKLILIADELGEMGPNVLSAAKGNLSKNDHFQMIGLSNPASRFDPFGTFSEPKVGWESVNVLVDDEWETRMNGLYIRLNSEESPNIDMTGTAEYEAGIQCPGVVNQEHIDADLDVPGSTPEEIRKTRNFMRFNSAVFFDGDGDETIYTEAEILRAGAREKTTIHQATKVCGCDPSYSDGGDKTALVFADEGFDGKGQHSVQVTEIVYLNEDMTNKTIPRTEQIAIKIVEECERRGVKPENFGIDASSGAGQGICDMLQKVWNSNAFLRVQFGGAASDKKISNSSRITGKQRYKNRATELFMQGKQYLMGRQLYGIPLIIAKQMCSRKFYEPTKGEKGLIYQIEKKKDYKARVGSSPDEADAFFVCVETAMVRRMFTANDPVPDKELDDLKKYLQGRRTHASFSADKMGFIASL